MMLTFTENDFFTVFENFTEIILLLQEPTLVQLPRAYDKHNKEMDSHFWCSEFNVVTVYLEVHSKISF